MNFSHLSYLSLASLCLAGCPEKSGNNPDTISSKPLPAKILATVNGKAITQSAVDLESQQLAQRNGGTAVPSDQVLTTLVNLELLKQEAVSKGLDKEAEARYRLEDLTRQVLALADEQAFVKNLPVTDAEVEREYVNHQAELNQPQIRARHIQVKSEQEARVLLSKIDKGDKFSDLASKYSEDATTKGKGGEIGWFSPMQVPPAITEAISKLKDGEITRQPVQSKFGWHVILREESRQPQVPSLDAVRNQLLNIIKIRRFQEHVAELRKAAEIEIKETAPTTNPR